MDAKAKGITSSAADALAQLRGLVVAAQAILARQRTALRARGMGLPSGVSQALAQIEAALADLESGPLGDPTELFQLRALARSGAAVNSTLSPDGVLHSVLAEAVRLSGAERGFIVLKDDDGGLVYRTVSEAAVMLDGAPKQVSTSILHTVLSTGQPMLTDNAYNDPRIQNNTSVVQFTLRSVICVPLVYRGAVTGALYVDNRLRAGVFRPRELTLLIAFANQVAVALENARLFARLQATLHGLTAMQALLDSLFTSLGSALLTTDAHDRITALNPAAVALTGVARDTALGQPLSQVMPLTAPALDTLLDVVRTGGQPVVAQVTTAPPLPDDVPRVLGIKAGPLRDGTGAAQGLTVVVDDLTQQVAREAELRLIATYLPPGLLEQIDAIAGIDLGGERREVTCVFVDTRPLASYPSGLAPHALLDAVNAHLALATRVINEADGVIDKYMGGEIMVLFNTQLNPQADHAARAVRCALALRAAFTEFYAREHGDAALGAPFDRVGLHTGVATLGNVGGLYRRSFTALGDVINLAKRLEEAARPGQVIASQDTARAAGSVAQWLGLPPIQVRGRTAPTQIVEVQPA